MRFLLQPLNKNYTAGEGWSFKMSINSPSMCTNKDCQGECAKQIPPKNYIYLPGDLIIVVTAPVHDM